MLTAEILANYIQNVLGGKYRIEVDHAFNKSYTRAADTPFGRTREVDFEKLDGFGGLIIGVLSLNTGSLSNVTVRQVSGVYTIDFWVPVDVNKLDANGRPLKAPEFDFAADMERLIAAVRGKTLEVDGYKLNMTISEPTLLSSNIDKTADYDRMTFRISGNAGFSDAAITTGSDFAFRFGTGVNAYTELKGFYGLNIGANTDNDAAADAGYPTIEQTPARSVQALSFRVDDIVNPENAAIMNVFRDKVFKHAIAISPWIMQGGDNPTEEQEAANAENFDRQNMLFTQIYKGGELLSEFWGALTASYQINGAAGFGVYDVALTNSEVAKDARL
jgi:hypothetical protein